MAEGSGKTGQVTIGLWYDEEADDIHLSIPGQGLSTINCNAASILVLFGAALVVLIQKASGLSPTPAKEMTYAEFTGVILSALGVILAALTIFLGVIAFYGWASFESLVERNTNNYLQDRFGTKETSTSDAQDVRDIVRQELALSSRSDREPENESSFDEEQL